jgi:Beta-ketoacyl synthase, N-terminal domain
MPRAAQPLSFSLPITRWHTWPPSGILAPDARPDVQFVEVNLRRRLSPLARMMLHVAQACAQDLPRLRLVFASRHGELNRTMGMLRELAQSAPLSPMAFSLSVHNTAAGIFSILRGDTAPATAIAAGDETLGYALLESFCQFESDPGLPVLMVYADEPLPQEYRGFATGPEPHHAIAVLLAPDAVRSVEFEVSASGREPPSPEPQSSAFLSSLAAGREGRWTGSQHSWTWH